MLWFAAVGWSLNAFVIVSFNNVISYRIVSFLFNFYKFFRFLSFILYEAWASLFFISFTKFSICTLLSGVANVIKSMRGHCKSSYICTQFRMWCIWQGINMILLKWTNHTDFFGEEFVCGWIIWLTKWRWFECQRRNHIKLCSMFVFFRTKYYE